MPELNVFFFGLICHIDRDNNGRPDFAAVVRNAGGHVPLLFVNGQERPLATHISFSQVQPPDTDHAYKAWVPNLKKIVGGELDVHRDNIWKVEYPRSDHGRAALSVADTYEFRAEHRSKVSRRVKRVEQPVARIIRLRVPIQDDRIAIRYVDFNGNPVADAEPISSDSCVLISNAEIGDDGDPNHFEYYSNIVAGDDRARAEEMNRQEEKAPHSVPEHCGWVIDYIDSWGRPRESGKRGEQERARASTRPECGNTNWP